MGNTSRAYTEEETREIFLQHIRDLSEYWSKQNGTTKELLDGLAFSILVTLDGDAADIPAFRVSPLPHEDDKKFYEENGENYFDENVDIGGCLHELYHKHTK